MYIPTFWLIVAGIAVAIGFYAYSQLEKERKKTEDQLTLLIHNMISAMALFSYRYTTDKPKARRIMLNGTADYIILSINSQVDQETTKDTIDVLTTILPEFKINKTKYNKANGKVFLTESGINSLRDDLAQFLDREMARQLKDNAKSITSMLVDKGSSEKVSGIVADLVMSTTEDEYGEFVEDVNNFLDNIEQDALKKQDNPTHPNKIVEKDSFKKKI